MSVIGRQQTENTIMISHRISPRSKGEMEALAELEGVNRSEMARRLIDEALAARAARSERGAA